MQFASGGKQTDRGQSVDALSEAETSFKWTLIDLYARKMPSMGIKLTLQIVLAVTKLSCVTFTAF